MDTTVQEQRHGSLSALEQFCHEAQRITPLVDGEEDGLLRQLQDGVAGARDRLVEAYQVFLLRLARRYAPRCASLSLLDLVQEGNLGLLAALDRVDKWDRTRPFRVWALGWAQKRMTRAAWSSDGLVRMSDHAARDLAQVQRTQSTLENAYGHQGHEAQIEDIARATHLTPRRVTRLLKQERPHLVSLEQWMEHGAEPEALSADDRSASEAPNSTFLMHRLTSAIRDLPIAERTVLCWRYGLHGYVSQTADELAMRLGIAVTLVREREQHALQTLRQKLARSGQGHLANPREESAAATSAYFYPQEALRADA